MKLLQILFACCRLSAGATVLRYDFSNNYNTRVTDLSSNSNDRQKPAIGSSKAVNTPYGLYLEGTTVLLPTNAYAGLLTFNDLISSSDFSMSLFVRYLPGLSGTSVDRELITFKSFIGTTRLQLRQQSAPPTVAPIFELEINFGAAATKITSSTYAVSKWYFFVISLTQTSYFSSDFSLCINGGATATATHIHANPKDLTTNYLNGGNTKAIYYAFQFENTSQACSYFNGGFDTGCAYVCYQGGAALCNVDTYSYDADCTDCGGSCGHYGCVNSSTLDCYTESCPPASASNASCNSCYPNSVKTTSDNSCECQSGYAQTARLPLTCAVCHLSCQTCDGIGATDCLTCKDPNATKSGAAEVGGTCSCDAYFYDRDPTAAMACSPCDLSCLSCDGPGASDCLSCGDPNAFKSGATGVKGPCSCSSQHYDSDPSTRMTCSACHSSCMTCNGDEASNCLSCSDPNATKSGTSGVGGTCSCNDHFYDSDPTTAMTCSACHPRCLHCDGKTDGDCLACNDPNATFSGGSCSCNASFFDSHSTTALTCTACELSCLSCDGPGASDCLSCKDPNATSGTAGVGGTCSCDAYFYDSDPTAVLTCSACDLSCLRCDGPGASDCLSCGDPNAFKSGATGVKGPCSCSSQYYNSDPSTRMVCSACHSSCMTCVGVRDADCLSCNDPNMSLDGGTCSCLASFFDADHSSSMTCQPCHISCSSCTDSSSCLTCADPQASVQIGKCVCREGFYDADTTDGVNCFSCYVTCKSCDGADASMCSACVDTHAVLVAGVGCVCREGYYEDSGSCLECAENCRTCKEADKCLSCRDDNASPINGICTCHAGLDQISASPLRCDSCREGTYYSSGKCSPCHEDCQTCSVFPQCTTCKDLKKDPAASGCLARVSFTLSVSYTNVLILSFSSQVTLTQAGLTLKVVGLTDFSFILEQISLTRWKITLITSQAISAGSQATVTITNPSISEDATLTNDSATGQLNAQAAPLTEEESDALYIGSFASLITNVAFASTAVASYSAGSMSSTWTLHNAIQFIGFLPMMNIDLPIGLSSFLKAVLNLRTFPNLCKYFVHDDSPQNIQSGRRIGKNSSLFLINADKQFILCFIMLCLWPVTYLLAKVKHRTVSRRFSAVSANFKWSFFIRFLFVSFLELTFAALFQLINSTSSSFAALVNVFLAGVFMALSFVAPVVIGFFICKNYQSFNDPAQLQLRREFGSVFDEFKNDRGLLSCSFYLLFLLRRLLYVGVLYFLQDFPLLQVILNVLHSLGALAYLLVFRPFKEPYLNFSSSYAELCISVTFGLSGLFLLDLSDSMKGMLMWVCIGVVYSMMLVIFIVTMILIVMELNRLKLKWIMRREKTKQL